MKDLIKKDKEQLGKRISKLREILSITQSQLGKSLGISKGTIAAMESGKSFTGDYLLAVVHFFSMSLSEFSKFDQPLPDELELRNRIKKYHEKNNSSTYKILDEPPNLKSLIEFRLAKSEFLKTPRTVKEITDFLQTEYNITFKSSVVSQALINAIDFDLLHRVSNGKRNYLYQVKTKEAGKKGKAK